MEQWLRQERVLLLELTLYLHLFLLFQYIERKHSKPVAGLISELIMAI
jgi:hypothetical protein